MGTMNNFFETVVPSLVAMVRVMRQPFLEACLDVIRYAVMDLFLMTGLTLQYFADEAGRVIWEVRRGAGVGAGIAVGVGIGDAVGVSATRTTSSVGVLTTCSVGVVGGVGSGSGSGCTELNTSTRSK